MKIGGLVVRLFRCQIDPMIGPKSRLAHVPEDNGWDAWVNEQETGIIVDTKKAITVAGKKIEVLDFVPFTNIQAAQFFKPEVKAKK